MRERLKRVVLKTTVRETVPGVRIPLPPPYSGGPARTHGLHNVPATWIGFYVPDGIHILEKPLNRMISQQMTVDWFCFWLLSEEDPDPSKAEQYKRWRELRKLQEPNTSAPLK